MVPRLRDFRVLASSGCGRAFHTTLEPFFSRSLFVMHVKREDGYQISTRQPFIPSESSVELFPRLVAMSTEVGEIETKYRLQSDSSGRRAKG